VGTIGVLEPSPHSLGEHPDMIVIWTFMKPMVQRTLKVVGISVDVTWEFTLETWDDIVEL
jgi:hypothetical protein